MVAPELGRDDRVSPSTTSVCGVFCRRLRVCSIRLIPVFIERFCLSRGSKGDGMVPGLDDLFYTVVHKWHGRIGGEIYGTDCGGDGGGAIGQE